MCPPGCLDAICRRASRRALLGKGLAAAAVAVAGVPAFAPPVAAAPATRSFSDVLDLTHPLFEGFPTFDGSKWFTMEPFLTYAKAKLNINRWTLMEHTGTHMDAPLHFSADGHSVDLIPVADLVVPMAVIDISTRAQDNPDSAVTPDDIKAWEAANGPLPEGCCVVMNSGWHRLLESPPLRWPRRGGQEPHAGLPRRDRPHAADRAQREGAGRRHALARHRYQHRPVPCPLLLAAERALGRGVPGHLDAVPAKGAHLVLGGPKVKGGTGGPSRVMALV